MVNPTRTIVKPNKGLWNSKRKVWFEKNDDDKLGSYRSENIEESFKALRTTSKEEQKLIKDTIDRGRKKK